MNVSLKKQISISLFAPLILAFLTLTACGAPEADRNPEDITAFTKIPSDFSDIAGHPAETDIREGYMRGLYDIPLDGRFRPDDPATRGEFVTALWRMAGRPVSSNPAPYGDMKDHPDETRDAAAWFHAENYPDDQASSESFFPDNSVTRQTVMAALFAYNGGVSGVEQLLTRVYDDGFTDSGLIADWGKKALYWGYFNELITDTASDRIDPDGVVSGGELAKIMVLYLDEFQNEPRTIEKEESTR